MPVKFAADLPLGATCKTTDLITRPVTASCPERRRCRSTFPGRACARRPRCPRAGGCSTSARRFRSRPSPVRRSRTGACSRSSTQTARAASTAATSGTASCHRVPSAARGRRRDALPANAPYASSAGYFNDAGCTQPIVGAGVSSVQCASYPVTLLRDGNGGANTRVFQAVLHAAQIYGGTPRKLPALPESGVLHGGRRADRRHSPRSRSRPTRDVRSYAT